MPFQNFLASIHIGAVSGWDICIIIVFLIAIFIYGFVLGRNRVVLILLCSYFSLVILHFMPWTRLEKIKWLGIGQAPNPSLMIIIFLALILFFYMFLPRSILSSVGRIRKKGEATWLQLLILAALQVGMFASVILSLLPKEAGNKYPLIEKIFLGPGAQFIWVALPIIVVSLIKRPRKSED